MIEIRLEVAPPQAWLKVTPKDRTPTIASEGFLWWAQENLNLVPKDCE